MYYAFQLNRAAAWSVNRWAGFVHDLWSNPGFPMAGTTFGRAVASAGEVLERVSRRYPGAPFGIETVSTEGRLVRVRETASLETPFCNLVHFARDSGRADPKVLLVAPLSGHHASLMRETVERLIPDHDLYVTDWIDARLVPLSAGRFDLDDYVDLLLRFLRHIGPDVHVIAVCQSCIPVLAAVAALEESGDRAAPRSMTLMSGPVDTRVSPTALNRFVAASPLALFGLTAVHGVPFGEPGFRRKVYPGFLQLAGFVTADSPRHLSSLRKLYLDLVEGDEDSARVHRRFYDDYLAVIDVPAEYYLSTVETVFREHALARGEMTWRGKPVRLDRIRRAALMTIEGTADGITPVGQTSAAHELCAAIPPERHQRHVVPGVGHFGVFRGRHWREEIAPLVGAFIRSSGEDAPARLPAPRLAAVP